MKTVWLLFALTASLLITSLPAAAQTVNSEFPPSVCDEYLDIPALRGATSLQGMGRDNTICVFRIENDAGTQLISLTVDIVVEETDQTFEDVKQEAADATFLCTPRDNDIARCEATVTDELDLYIYHDLSSNTISGREVLSVYSVENYLGYVLYVRSSEVANPGPLRYSDWNEQARLKTQAIIDRLPGGLDDATDDADGNTTQRVFLEVTQVKDDVEIRPSGGTWQEASVGMKLYEGDEIYTAPDSELLLRLPDRSVMKVKESSQIRVRFVLKQGSGLQAQLLLRIGKVSARVNPNKTSFTDFEIKAPVATASVRGTLFSMEYDDQSNEALVQVEEGTVEVASDTGEVLIEGGKQARVATSGIAVEDFSGTIDLSEPNRAGLLFGVIAATMAAIVVVGSLYFAVRSK